MVSDEEYLKGNKGEWSELYVFLKLLGDGRVYGADQDLQRKSDRYYDINTVIRDEGNGTYEYVVDSDNNLIKIIVNNKILGEITDLEIIEQYRYLFQKILEGKGSFEIPETQQFMKILKVTKIKAPSSDKTDISFELTEPKTGLVTTQGFSIKSKVGSPSTLVNASVATNFIFALDGGMNEEIAKQVNGLMLSESKTKVVDGLFILRNNGIKLRYSDTENKTLSNNLTMIDSSLPQIVAEMLLLYYDRGISHIMDQIRELNRCNPLKYRNPGDTPYYDFKVKRLLTAYALGMRSSKPWHGDEEANGGYIVVKKDGDIVCYHIYDRKSFENYLVANTKMETASTSKHGFGLIFKEDGEYKIKLNLQIRFT